MSNEHEILQHFATINNSLFLCVLWKMLLETDQISPVAYKVINQIDNKYRASFEATAVDETICIYFRKHEAKNGLF